jgi:hypothetical protein
MRRFSDLKHGLQQLTADPHWLAKVLLGGFLLINPFLLALAPAYFSPAPPAWIKAAFPWLLVFNVLSFWFPLGFTFEVLRRARTGRGTQLPEWRPDLLKRYAYEGMIKFILACATILLPAGIWIAIVYLVFVCGLRLHPSTLSLLAGPAMWLVIPFCAVACCRWLDGVPVWNCALNYRENWRIFRKGLPDYLIASAFLMGVNAVTNGLFYTIPFAAVFGLCMVDLWFGPIYAEIVDGATRADENRP